MVSREAARQPLTSNNMVPSKVALLHSAQAPEFGEVGSVPSTECPPLHGPPLTTHISWLWAALHVGVSTESCLPSSPQIESDSLFSLVDFSCVTEERELEISLEVRSVFWLRRRLQGGLDSRQNLGFEVRHPWIWIQLWSYRCVTLSKLINKWRC